MRKNQKQLLVYNGNIYSMVHEDECFRGMWIKNGKISRLIKNDEDVLSFRTSQSLKASEMLDLKGRTALPGLIDTHFHFMPTAALREMALSVSEVSESVLLPKDLNGVKKKLLAYSKEIPLNLPLMCFNYIIPGIKEDRLPTRFELDEWLPDRRIVIILSMDGHSSSYSTGALQELEINHDIESHNGILTGADHEFNLGKVNSLVQDSLTLPLLIKGVQSVLNDAIAHGIVGLHCLDGFEELEKDIALWFFTTFMGIFPLYLRLFPQIKNPKRVKKYTKKMTYPRLGGCGAWEQDGSVGSQTAAFDESFQSDTQNFGKLYYSPEEMENYVKNANEAGFQITSHAIGPRAIENILQAYEKTLGSSNPKRHRIDHFEFPRPDHVVRAIDHLNLIITAQPGYAWMDEKYQKAYRRYLRPSQFDSQIPMKTIMEKRGILCGASDSPVQELDPFIQLQGMVDFPLQSQKLSVFQAFRTYTYNAAFATFEENERGTLELGKWADFILFDKNPFKIPKTDIIDLSVSATYIHGKLIRPFNYSTLGFLLRFLFTKQNKL